MDLTSIYESNLMPCLLLAALAIICLVSWGWRWASSPSSMTKWRPNDSELKRKLRIIPLHGFNWKSTEPLQLRPFRGKEKYNLTMGKAHPPPNNERLRLKMIPILAIENLDPSELIQMDKTYQDRITKRQAVLKKHHDIIVAVNEPRVIDIRIRAAVSELYTFILKDYLPTRYPSMFRLENCPENGPNGIFQNLVTGAKWPTRLADSEPTVRALEILTQTVDEEFLILLPDLSAPKEAPVYVLQAYATCFPSGFNTREKLGLRLSDIHGPVPGYAQKLERSMDRFFAKIEVGRVIKRVNWGITTETDLFAAFGSIHASPTADPQQGQVIPTGKLNLEQTVLRSERQTLHRLPETRALVFAFHTYTYPLQQIKEEGLGKELATAIEGLKKGNVPAIYSYKRGDVWGQAVTDFLRS
ncbi:uncharacterized protein N7469_004326 [Penicillium citrinum]|uniref:Uncharacterized protein n=1 Tax=Penicillium citrinum TaxID=5077 RepID=A0A9W9P497_PENCI|nr:uncharacterized protein N7469_004326 [Penicillium citrinum]KAJ5235158.1 hypothetical protein N7469_004326 [Penicillium citrinum]